jgi:phosphoserine aminotransferase
MKRVFNFSPGPAMLPDAVLQRVQRELLDWQGSGMSVMEVSHRGTAFIEFAAASEKNLRSLLGVPDGYKVLFLQGGATLQFAAVPLNLAPPGATADYVVTGNWGEKAVSEAKRYLNVNVAADSSATKFTTIPDPKTWKITKGAAYLHYTPNETVFGVEFHGVPAVSDALLVADMSSTLLSRPIDVSRFGLIYAGAQKNIGPAGLALVIVREDLLGRARKETPGVIDYKTMAANDSMWNTPSTLSWYIADAAIDGSDFYGNPVEKSARSWMNVPFTLADPELDKAFLQESKAAGLTNLKGHRVVGGMRASLYNAMPEAGVDALVAFMADFEKRKA